MGQDIVRATPGYRSLLAVAYLFPINGLWITSGQAENDIAASAATKSTLGASSAARSTPTQGRVDDICGDAADDILTTFGRGRIGINNSVQREKIISLLFL